MGPRRLKVSVVFAHVERSRSFLCVLKRCRHSDTAIAIVALVDVAVEIRHVGWKQVARLRRPSDGAMRQRRGLGDGVLQLSMPILLFRRLRRERRLESLRRVLRRILSVLWNLRR